MAMAGLAVDLGFLYTRSRMIIRGRRLGGRDRHEGPGGGASPIREITTDVQTDYGGDSTVGLYVHGADADHQSTCHGDR